MSNTFIGRGVCYCDGRDIGLVDAYRLNMSENEEKLFDYTQGGGGVYDSNATVEDSIFVITFREYKPDNLAIAVRGSNTGVATAAVTDESMTCPSDIASGDRLVTAANLINTSAAVTVKDGAGTAGTTIATSAWTKKASGILVTSGGAITAGETFYVSYTKRAANLIKGLATSGQQYEWIIDGLNDAQSGLPFRLQIYKGKPGPTDGLDFISQGFAESSLSITCVKDTTRSAGDQYFNLRMASA